ncbi:hypothetical protein ACFDTO_26870 [Microbacteriaceae bacterium 4G12]
MQKDIWKWIFQEIPDESFFQLVEKSNVSIPGFRKIDRKLSKRLRSKLINELIKPNMLTALKKILALRYDYKESPYLTKTKEELLVAIKNPETMFEVFIVLLGSDIPEKVQLAEELYEESIQQAPVLSVSSEQDDQRKEQQEVIRQLEEKVKKYEEKNVSYRKQISNIERGLHEKEKEAKKHYTKVQEFSKTCNLLKEKYNMYKVTCATQKEQNKMLEQVLKQKDEEIQQQLSVIEEKQQEINRLNALCLTLTGSSKRADVLPASFIEMEKGTVAIIGDVLPKYIPDQKGTIFSSAELDGALEQNKFDKYERVCLLRFSITQASLRKVKRLVDNDKIQEFHNVQELQRFLQWGNA